MICNVTSDSHAFDYFLEEALVKKSVEPNSTSLSKTSSLRTLIGVKLNPPPANKAE